MMVCAVMVLGCTMVAQAQTTHTQQEAMNWLQSKVGTGIDFDGIWGNQCVDLIKAYYQYLGVAPVSGNGIDYTWNAVPAGWTRIQGAIPQTGDILVYTGGAQDSEGNYLGHVAICESPTVTYHQNYSNHPYVERITGIRYDGFTADYWGVIRPDFNNKPIEVSLTWSGDRCEPDSSNVFVYTEAHTNISGSFTEAGITIWDESGNVVASKSENPARTGMQLNIYYNVTDELGVVLKSGTNYTYQFYTVFNGTKYTTDVKSFRTKGMAENSWTQELNIADWTYGETPNAPAAAAKYGTPSFTYSNEKDGTYTADVPQAAGTYYVKATVAAVNDQYTGLEAVKEFRINKANPEYSVPQDLTMIYSNRLESVTLPEGFSWYDSTELSGPVGERLAYAFYTPADTDNYNVVEMIEIPITVQAKDLSGMKVEGIDKNTDLDKYEIKDGDTVLVKDQDYVISSETKGDTVTVTVEFKGNYTGKTQTSYSLKTSADNADKNEDKAKTETESAVPKTGDNSMLAIWAVMLVLAGGAVVVTAGKRKSNR